MLNVFVYFNFFDFLITDMKDVLIDTTKEAVVTATTVLTSQISSMENRVVQLDDFAESVRSMRHVHTTKDTLENDITSVEEMFRLLHNLDVKVSHVMAVQLDDMRAGKSSEGASIANGAL